MRAPNVELALVAERKVTDYLLSEERSEGKAAFFAAFGFMLARWDILRDALLAHAISSDVAHVVSTQYGVKYVVEGSLETPDGRNPLVRSVWIVNMGAATPLLITTYPQ